MAVSGPISKRLLSSYPQTSFVSCCSEQPIRIREASDLAK
jgi:hypothetical protein